MCVFSFDRSSGHRYAFERDRQTLSEFGRHGFFRNSPAFQADVSRFVSDLGRIQILLSVVEVDGRFERNLQFTHIPSECCFVLCRNKMLFYLWYFYRVKGFWIRVRFFTVT